MSRLNEVTSLVRRAADEFNMIDSGDTVCVGVSGGKDSLVLLCALASLRGYYPKPFSLHAITLDLGFEGMDFAGVLDLCSSLGVPYTLIKTDVREIVFDVRQEKNPCSLCSKMRRGALNNAIKQLGSNKLALGHHRDDAIETFLMSLIFEGRINCFKPVTYMSRADVYQIRPLLYVGEDESIRLTKELSLPVVTSTCPLDRDSKRAEIKQVLAQLEETYPDIRAKIFGAMKRLPLPGWDSGEAAVPSGSGR
ncbi:MAG: tRNA 2-thiocytidine(32) synthetase TtcA [Oscillospiraceae bacterium]|jgi:tRNA(Ile)-lysidine synthase TilS/MesJ|nr:tRNA 2-thiocytidine(32) synthetase TtcA [Oscillospiraceae bacterium]